MLRSLILSLLSACLMVTGIAPLTRAADPFPDHLRLGGFATGVQADTFRQHTLFEAIDGTKGAGGKVLELELGQRLSPSFRNVIVDENMAEADLQRLKVRLDLTGIKAVNAFISSTNFVRYGKNEDAYRRVFAFAKKLGLRGLTGEPAEDQLDLIEIMAKEFDLTFSIHNSQKDSKPDYKYWDPRYTLALLKNRDPRLGVCLDTANLVRSGLKPVETVRMLKDRLLSVHLRDSNGGEPESKDTPFGSGVADIAGILKELHRTQFSGHIAIEYQSVDERLVQDLTRCVDFIRVEGERIHQEALRDAAKTVSVPKGFRYEVLLQGELPEPVDLEFAPDGRLWITSRRGYIWAYSLSEGTKTLIAQMQVAWQPIPGREANERGLHGIEFDPHYSTNGFVYLHYAPVPNGTTAFVNRVSRFTVSQNGAGTNLLPDSERVLLEYPSVRGFHQGGAIEYNVKDKKLYVTTGDNNVSGETKDFYKDPSNPPQLLNDLRGKVLRLNLDGSIPSDNPFVKTPNARGEIFTYGHRNPYSMNVDPQTGHVFVGEVGYDRPEDYEEINLLVAGGNYGWPRCIGPNLGTYGGVCPLPDAVQPWLFYRHDNGANVTSGPIYRTTGISFAFPAQYHNGMFYADFTRKWIRFAEVEQGTGKMLNNVPFARGLAGGPLSVQLGPDGALYFIEYAGWFTGTPNDRLSRIVYAP